MPKFLKNGTIKKLGLIFLGIIVVFSLSYFNFNNKTQLKAGFSQSSGLTLTSSKVEASPALLPLSQNQESEKDCFSVITKPGAITEQVENLIPNPTSAVKIELKENILAVIDWDEKEEEVDEARLTSSVPLGMQCGGRTLSPFGIGPVFPRVCCTGCCVPCIPLVCCSDCGCCVASCAVKCTCVSGAGAAYLWDSITGLCGCGI